MSSTHSTSGLRVLFVLVSVLIILSPCALADLAYTGTIKATFSDPILKGNIVELNRSVSYLDNTNTAVYSILNSDTSAEVIWGDDNGGGGHPSELIFFVAPFTDVPPDVEFPLGTLTYNNGSSNLDSLIFGATLTLEVVDQPSITPIVTNVQILTTRNGLSLVLDADYVSFPAPWNINFHVYEAAGATASVTASIVGDPVLTPGSLILSPDETGGFLSLPEPNGLWLWLCGAGIVSAILMRSRPAR